jgi:hypothetical protein
MMEDPESSSIAEHHQMTEDPPAQVRTDMVNTARNLRRMKRRLLMLCVQVEPNTLPDVGPVSLKKEAPVSKKRSPWKTQRKNSRTESASKSHHSKTKSCLF